MITLRMIFKGGDGKQLTVSFQNAKETAAPADIRGLVDKIIEHKALFHGTQPAEFVGAEFLITSKVPVAV
jgi:hypothetical protein